MTESTALLELKNVSVFFDKQKILDDVEVSFAEGELVGILGINGAGKTTLVKTLLGLMEYQGKISFAQQPVATATIAHYFGYVPQVTNFERNFPITVSEIFELEKKCADFTNPAYNFSAEHIFDLHSLLAKKISDLSGGQLQKVIITRALLSHPRILVMDEPTNNLDRKSIKIFDELLGKLHDQGVTVIIVTHNHDVLHSLERLGRLFEVQDKKVIPHVDN